MGDASVDPLLPLVGLLLTRDLRRAAGICTAACNHNDDEGDGIYDSVVLLDNFRFHELEAVGNTDPLN